MNEELKANFRRGQAITLTCYRRGQNLLSLSELKFQLWQAKNVNHDISRAYWMGRIKAWLKISRRCRRNKLNWKKRNAEKACARA